MSTSKPPAPRKGSRKASGTGRRGKANGAPTETSPSPGGLELPKAPQPRGYSADLAEFQAKLDLIRNAIGEAIEIGIKLAARSGPIPGSDLVDAVDSGTVATPEPPYPPTTQMIKDLAAELLQHPDLWFQEPNPRFGGRKPVDMLGTKDEIRIWWALSAADAGLF